MCKGNEKNCDLECSCEDCQWLEKNQANNYDDCLDLEAYNK